MIQIHSNRKMVRPDEHIIIRFIQGQASEQELSEIHAWIHSSEDNARALFQLEALYQQMTAQAIPAIQIEEALRKVLSSTVNSQPSTVNSQLSTLFKYAAILILGILLGGGLIYKIGVFTPQQEMLLAQAIETPREIRLADGSHVWLNKGAQLRYPETFEGKERQVELEGEGYFEVAKDTACPFIVKSEVMTVKVLGTKFNFKTQKELKTGEVSLIEGSVGVRNNHVKDMVVLSPGQKAEIDPRTGMLKVSEQNTRLSAVWHDDLIPFENANLREIATTLESVYGVKVVFQGNPDMESTYSGCIRRKESIDSVLRLLCHTLPVRYQVSGNTVVIRN